MVQITGTDPDGDAIARPAEWDAADGPPPLIFMAAGAARTPGAGARRAGPGPAASPPAPGRYEGRTIRRLTDAPGRVLGVYRKSAPGGGRIVPTDRRAKAEWVVPPGEDGGAEHGEIVLAEPLPHHRLGLKPARIIERLGAMGDARSVSLIAIHTHDIPQAFPPAAWQEADAPQRHAARPAHRPARQSRWSPSTARTRATSTMRCMPNRTGPASA